MNEMDKVPLDSPNPANHSPELEQEENRNLFLSQSIVMIEVELVDDPGAVRVPPSHDLLPVLLCEV